MILISAGLLFFMRAAAKDRRTTPLLAGDVQAPIAAWLGAPFRTLEDTVADLEDGRRALQENKALRAELETLRAQNSRLRAQSERLRRLDSHLGVRLTGDIPDRRISARAVSDPSSPFVRSLLIGTGQADGIRDGYPVMSEVGLVGHIVSAGQRSARVLRLDDLNSRVAVISERSGARAILAGNNTDMPRLAFVAEADDWQDGDRILTSGDDGRLPMGLPVGTLLFAETRDVALHFIERPVDWVFILPYEGLANPDDVSTAEPIGGTKEEQTEDAIENSEITSASLPAESPIPAEEEAD